MSNGRVVAVDRSVKATLRWLDYVASKPMIWALADVRTPSRFILTCGLKYKDIKKICRAVRRDICRLSQAERIRFKYRLWWKYGDGCAYCHRSYDWRHCLTIDHIHPISKGGALRDVSNMVLACLECNRRKADSWL